MFSQHASVLGPEVGPPLLKADESGVESEALGSCNDFALSAAVLGPEQMHHMCYLHGFDVRPDSRTTQSAQPREPRQANLAAALGEA